ncbi:MAG: GDYXXLXY domain-containing protein [Desulfotomaculaceae bacterium]|nr:GDYXXLXY domain-containing protein [Desulfotomaculaceae bacterium]
MKRRYKTGIIIILQLLFLFALIGVKYYTLSAGAPVLLKAVPVDPWDMFRGEYVMLEYEINWIKNENLNIEDLQNKDVYVVLEKGEKYWHAAGVYVDKPDLTGSQLFVKGKVNYFDEFKEQYHVSYGIESYYVEEGTGMGLQQARAFDAQIRIDRFGNAVIKKII